KTSQGIDISKNTTENYVKPSNNYVPEVESISPNVANETNSYKKTRPYLMIVNNYIN
ncbi:27777_t:CDS:1, partial [Dentiscutata erythropus]